jgi:hypothetical protein
MAAIQNIQWPVMAETYQSSFASDRPLSIMKQTVSRKDDLCIANGCFRVWIVPDEWQLLKTPSDRFGSISLSRRENLTDR